MSGSYLAKFATNYPELVGKPLYLCPSNPAVEIKCRLNIDGTLSSTENDDRSFPTVLDLVHALHNPSIKNCNAKRDLFLEPNRKISLRAYEMRCQREKSTTPKIPAAAKPKRKCHGFRMVGLLSVFNLHGDYKPIGLARQLSALDDKGICRSNKCSGFRGIKIRPRSLICSYCSMAKASAIKHVESLRLDGLLCRGIKAESYVQLIEERKWRNERRSFSPVDFVGLRLFAKECSGEKLETDGRRCESCQKAARTMCRMNYRRRNPTAKSDDNRWIFAANSRLTAAERMIKERVLKRRRDERREKAKRELERMRAERKRLVETFVPKDQENGAIAVGLVARLDSETDRTRRLSCRWIVDGARCDHTAASNLALLAHIVNIHVVQQRDAHRQLDDISADISYVCAWDSCSRRGQPFPSWKTMYHHAKVHAGCIETNRRRLETVKNQIVNLTRTPTNRQQRHAAKESTSANPRGKEATVDNAVLNNG